MCRSSRPPVAPASLVYSFGDNAGEAKVSNCLDWRPSWAKGPDGLLYPALFQHPPDPQKGVGEAAFSIALPKPKTGRRLVLRFGTVLTGPSYDGVRMSIMVDGAELWSETQTQQDRPKVHALDLCAHAGKAARVTLRVDALKNNGADWSNWLRRVVVEEGAGK